MPRHPQPLRSVLAGVALLTAFGTAGAARAGELYGTGAVGASWPFSRGGWDPATGYSFTDTISGGFSGELGLGCDFGPVRTELTDSYEDVRLNGYSDLSGSYAYNGGQQGTQSLLVSAYGDINTNSRWTPHLGGGLSDGLSLQSDLFGELMTAAWSVAAPPIPAPPTATPASTASASSWAPAGASEPAGARRGACGCVGSAPPQRPFRPSRSRT